MTKELEAEIAELKATIERNQGEYEGKLTAMQTELDTATSHATDLSSKLKKFEDEEEAKRKAIRTENEAKVHAIPIHKDKDVSNWSDDRLDGFVSGLESAPKAHSTQAPPAGATGTTPVPQTAADRLKQR